MPAEVATPSRTQPNADVFDIGPDNTDIQGAPVVPQQPRAAAAPSPAAAQRPKPPEHAPYMVEMARDFFTDAEINGFSPADLAAHVRGAQRFLLNERNQRSATAALEPQRVDTGGGSSTTGIPPKPGAEITPTAPVLPEKDGLAVLDSLKEDMDERWWTLFDTMRQKIKRLEGLEPEVKGLRQSEMSRQQRQVFDVIDGAFDLLGTEHEKTFGTGPAAQMPNTPELKRRRALMQLANIDFTKSPTSKQIAAVLKPLAEEVFGVKSATVADLPNAPDPYGLNRNGQQQQPAAAPKPAERPRGPDGRFLPPTPEEWKEAETSRPSARDGSPELPGEKKAIKTAAEWLRNRGYDEDGNKALDGFL